MDNKGTSQALFKLTDIVNHNSAGFTIDIDGEEIDVVAVRKKNDVFVYVNDCPHVNAPLNLHPDRFLNVEKNRILCVNHWALFRIEDGVCVHGPCRGDHLEPIPVEVRDGTVYLLP